MRSKNKIEQEEKKLKELLDKTTYSVFEYDPELEHSILTNPCGAFQRPMLPRPKAPKFGFFDTTLEALRRVQDTNDYMEELLEKNTWAEESQIYKGRTLTDELDGHKKKWRKNPPTLLDEILNRHGRKKALLLFTNMDQLCEAVTERGSRRVSYSSWHNLSAGGRPPMRTGNDDSLRMGEPAPRIDLDDLDSRSASSGTSGSRTPQRDLMDYRPPISLSTASLD
ncbi:hypothetical protein FS837_002392 [Tulasnella sp. UAMH 9824]|nr:hypothetical protein FS837_002392 [Tulasnella sp. UAMH 9824]